ncbi:hypothetical protein CDD82_6005 [Ophiocordyceps australis]|uniref:Peptidase M4 C-terminal domain-containing protein n=1 Tax=Ophiocordyceps australis TaxID=1399860 RepID=A0A2C5YWE2_9HYPO|nr:hypothetical protein CDD82_6005 [Ophiocordyceps australis]
MSCPCFFIPPHIFRGIADSEANPQHVRQAAQEHYDAQLRMSSARREHMENIAQARKSGAPALHRVSPSVPENVLARISTSCCVDEATRDRAKKDLGSRQAHRVADPVDKDTAVADEPVETAEKDSPYRAVYDAHMTQSQFGLPGELIRAEGEPKVGDQAVNDAYDNVGNVLEFYKEVFKWNSIDNKNADVISSVHYGRHYQNAFWDGRRMQMVFGDGGEYLGHFTSLLDVIGHELTHAVTEHTSPLNYMDQPGALNESVSDVFGIMIKQKKENQKADESNWLIGEGTLMPGVHGVALRSMKAPGTAYDDKRLGKDPQVGNTSEYKPTFEDNGGVHIYSGIPNKAFYLVAKAFGGYSWEKAGQIWWKTMNSGKVPSNSTFKQFADATVSVAKDEFGEEEAKTVRKAWNDVGVTRS